MIVTRVFLAPRERQVLEGLAAGNTLAVVAQDLKIREGTAASYLRQAKTKLHRVSETPAAIAVGYATRAIPHPPLLDPGTLYLPREQRALVPLIARGMGLAHMATELNRPVNDVRADGRELLTKLGARNRNHLIPRAWQVEILTTDQVATWLR
ncbi:LuxR C-terminal-related transcriptional regulator [Streptomyces sp. 35G-GA-8]|uniref:LuxR C-terminal-related transcriptional regulator n=1 Tax=Streptomyces sp. 35G-GA-8 TaxID=2939434 RepID=UPI00201F56D1|nr:LuxR C-terminal-related transcriptional regulator [Streptomyces sp. 35G-GA-8]MCL7381273.1 LuxR C-terminal-related transcriptional regulator [Streptomyces sp. 35G-GA-8]